MSVACGEPLVDGSYQGAPLLELQGQVTFEQSGSVEGASDPLRVVVLWAGPSTADSGVKIPSLPVEASFPASYTASVFNPPPASAIDDVPDGLGQVALGAVVVFRDLDGDGRWTVGRDRAVGGAPWRGVLYSPGGADSPWFGRVGSGYTRVRVAGSKPELACPVGGYVRLEIDEEPTLDLAIGTEALGQALFDLDCDGLRLEWSGLCPAERTRACRDGLDDTCRLCGL